MHQVQTGKHKLLAAIILSSMSLPVQADSGSTEVLKRLALMEQRLQALEAENRLLKKSLNEPYISDSEPEVSARLKAVESQSSSYKSMAKIVENLQGIEVAGGLTMAAQGLSGQPDNYTKDSEVNYRGDVSISMPAGSIGASEGVLFAHFRVGQGLGLENPGSAFSSFNSTSFQRPGTTTSDSTVLLAQAWYQLNIPLPLGGNPDLSRQHIEMNIGKMDPFMFFDQNRIADNETRGFINQSFVHNPLLDTGGDIGVDDFGFTPGFRMAWVNDFYKPEHYSLSFGAFGAGDGASFDDTLSDPFIIIQAETRQQFFSGLSGNYRVYYWNNSDRKDLRGNKQSHAGIGISIDQQVDDYISLFARYGYQTDGEVKFDSALTFGAEIGGSYWQRGGDALGAAIGFLNTSSDYEKFNSEADGNEQLAELYYRYRINNQLHLSPNLQYIYQPGGEKNTSAMTTLGLRAQLDF